MSTATSPGPARTALPNSSSADGRLTLVRHGRGCALLVTVAEAIPDLALRLRDLAPIFLMRGLPLLGVSVAQGAPDAGDWPPGSLPFDAFALGDESAEAAALRLVDRFSAP